MTRTPLLAALAAATLALTACSPASDSTAEADASASGAAALACTKDALATRTPGTLTIATGEPAYEPWVKNDKPESGEGFEAAVAYAAAAVLGFEKADVTWVRTTFDSAIAPGDKTFDWNLQQFSITEDREKSVDFSSSYYDVNQAIVSYAGSPIASAGAVADLASAKLGAAVGTTSLEAAQEISSDVQVFNDNATAVSALKNEQIDGIVVDLPTAFYLVAVEVDDGVIVGQLPAQGGDTTDSFGILMGNNSPLTPCTTQAVDQLRADGTLAEIEQTWLGTDAGAPTLS